MSSTARPRIVAAASSTRRSKSGRSAASGNSRRASCSVWRSKLALDRDEVPAQLGVGAGVRSRGRARAWNSGLGVAATTCRSSACATRSGPAGSASAAASSSAARGGRRLLDRGGNERVCASGSGAGGRRARRRRARRRGRRRVRVAVLDEAGDRGVEQRLARGGAALRLAAAGGVSAVGTAVSLDKFAFTNECFCAAPDRAEFVLGGRTWQPPTRWCSTRSARRAARARSTGRCTATKPVDLVVGLMHEMLDPQRAARPQPGRRRRARLRLAGRRPGRRHRQDRRDQGRACPTRSPASSSTASAPPAWRPSTSPPRRSPPAGRTSSSPAASSRCRACRWAPTAAPGRWTPRRTTTPRSSRRASAPT